MPGIRKSFFLVLSSLIVIIAGVSAQTNFYSIADGFWNDPSVWSTDGLTPCECTPSYQVNSNEVVIAHAVKLDAPLHIRHEGILKVTGRGLLLAPDQKIHVREGHLVAEGPCHLGGLEIDRRGYAQFSASMIIEHELMIAGRMDVLFRTTDSCRLQSADIVLAPDAELFVENARIILYQGGLLNQGRMELVNSLVRIGDCAVTNEGTLALNRRSVFLIDGGSFDNLGELRGQGGIKVMDGNLTNAGRVWTGVRWCGRRSTGIPVDADCEAVDELVRQCSLRDMTHFTGICLDIKRTHEGIIVSWTSDAEHGFYTYDVEKADDRILFYRITSIAAPETKTSTHQLHFIDTKPLPGRAYYRVAGVDLDGHRHYAELRTIGPNEQHPVALHAHPDPDNPAQVYVMLTGIQSSLTGMLEVYDPGEQRIVFKRLVMTQGNRDTVILSDISAGLYDFRFSNAWMDCRTAVSFTSQEVSVQ